MTTAYNAINVLIPPLKTPYTYLLPNETDANIGDCLTLPFNRRHTQGYVVEKLSNLDPKSYTYELKTIKQHDTNHSCFTNEQLNFFRWISNYYCENLSNIIASAIPKYVSDKKIHYIKLLEETIEPKGKVQKQIVKLLNENNLLLEKSALIKSIPNANSSLKSLEKNNFISIETKKDLNTPTEFSAPSWAKTKINLNPEQEKACSDIKQSLEQSAFEAFLLYGVTGSGKTEVYLDAINKAIEQAKGILLIVPEIALTPQLIDRFAARLNEPFAILHSALSNRDRWSYWQKLLSGKIKIAIGARSAIFAPVNNLGLIIVDEEHDGSYKQSDNLRYNARDLAIVRAKLNNCPVVLGSATPSLETLLNVKNKKYQLLKLLTRYSSTPKNNIQLVDLSKIKNKEMPTKNISPALHKELEQVLERKEQAFILYNRRGFACYLQCERCNTVLTCPACSITLTYHKNKSSFLCHSCGFNSDIPQSCDTCKEAGEQAADTEFVERGAGTEKVYEELLELFPGIRLERLDRDTVDSPKDYRKILEKVRNHEVDVLVGTQMIAKGHDLPNVTLVGVIDCDIGLNIPDFRASERVFQLLTQVSGRAGRADKPGNVILQTRAIKHPSLRLAAEDNFMSFANHELNQRKLLNYPPFSRLLRVVYSAIDQDQLANYVVEAGKLINDYIKSNDLKVVALGPVVAPIAKLRSRWRWHMIFKSNSSNDLQKIANAFSTMRSKNKKVRITIDFDPQEML